MLVSVFHNMYIQYMWWASKKSLTLTVWHLVRNAASSYLSTNAAYILWINTNIITFFFWYLAFYILFSINVWNYFCVCSFFLREKKNNNNSSSRSWRKLQLFCLKRDKENILDFLRMLFFHWFHAQQCVFFAAIPQNSFSSCLRTYWLIPLYWYVFMPVYGFHTVLLRVWTQPRIRTHAWIHTKWALNICYNKTQRMEERTHERINEHVRIRKKYWVFTFRFLSHSVFYVDDTNFRVMSFLDYKLFFIVFLN